MRLVLATASDTPCGLNQGWPEGRGQWLNLGLAVFIDEDAPGVDEGKALSSESMITSGMNEVLTLYTGAVQGKKDSKLKHTPLLTTGDQSGLVSLSDLANVMNRRAQLSEVLRQQTPYLSVAVAIEGSSAGPMSPHQAIRVRIASMMRQVQAPFDDQNHCGLEIISRYHL